MDRGAAPQRSGLSGVVANPASSCVGVGMQPFGVGEVGLAVEISEQDAGQPDGVLRLLRRLAADPQLPAGVRVRVALLVGYLALPLDLIPDVIPLVGYADDAIIATAVLRSVVRRAGLAAVRSHWPGTPDGFAAVCRLAGLVRRPPS